MTAGNGHVSSAAKAGEQALRGLVRAAPGLTVLTGGQTGVDTYAAVAALQAGLTVHLVFPAGYRQEDGPLTPARRRRFAGAILHELPSESFRYRTWTCAYLADAVLLLDPAGGSGCRETVRAATGLARPLLISRSGALTAAQTTDWLASAGARVFMVAGCRASVLASKGKGRGLRTELAEIMAGARHYHDELISAASE
ncbi:MAG TPA: putative molybdenum carrier protein [Streptosporangiaceae bacterium]|nr:putative molybdenum carrier protein [Streptosporangiaceae bacterium]